MEQQLQFIQQQLWFVIGLFLLLIATNIICYFVRKTDRDKEPRFGEMWDKGDLDKLIKKSREHLIEYPNHQSALYFCAKALVAKKESLAEAKRHLTKLQEIDPTLSKQAQEVVDEIKKIEGS